MNPSSPDEASDSRWRFTTWLVFLYAGVSLIGVLHHEMWRDELQAWTLARDSSSLADLWRNMRTESHLMLWHTLLFFLTRVTQNPVAMQWFHWLIAVTAVALFVRFSPFTPFQKILFCFGYYPLYEYCAISRNYSLGMLLLFLFFALAQRRPRNYIALASVIGLLSCVHFFDVPIAWTLMALLAFDYVRNRDEREHLRRHPWTAIAGVSIVVLCQVFSAIQVWRGADQGLLEVSPVFQLRDVWTGLTWMWRVFFPIPLIKAGTFGWNTNLWADASQVGQDLAVVLSGVLVILFLVLFWLRSRRAFLMYSLGTSLLLAAQFAMAFGSLRHMGKHYLLLVASCWIATGEPASSRVNGLAARSQHLLNGLVTTIFAIHVVAGAVCYWFGIRTVFSAAKPTVQYLTDNGLTGKLIAVTPDASATAISGYLGKKVYAADSRRMQGFTSCDSTYFANTNKPEDAVVREVLGMLSDATNQIILITRSRLLVPQGQDFQPLETLAPQPGLRIAKLAQFPETITDEKFFVYTVEKVSNGPPVNP